MTPPIILCPEFIGVVRGLINTPPYQLSQAGRFLFYDITATSKLRAVFGDYDKDTENVCYYETRYGKEFAQ